MARWLLLVVALVVFGGGRAAGADRLILRNLEIVSDRTVTRFDEDGVVLDQARAGGTDRIAWDEIERGRVAQDQERFDALLAELGLPLFRVRQRIKAGDYGGAGAVAETLYPRFAERRSQTAYLVCQATMWSRIASGRREAAVEPFLRCYELLRSRAAASSRLPGSRRLNVDEATALTAELPPVWFDAEAAKSALTGVEAAIRALATPRPVGVYVYYATLATAAEEPGQADKVLPLLENADAAVAGLAELVQAYRQLPGEPEGAAVERLRQRLSNLPESCRLAAYYIVGLADAASAEAERCQGGLLMLLTLPAAYGDSHPELAAAALYQAAAALDKLKEGEAAAAVRGELAARYAGTRFARLARTKQAAQTTSAP